MRISIRGRLTTIVLMSLLSVGFLGFLFVSQSLKDVAFAQKELAGTALVHALEDDLRLVASLQKPGEIGALNDLFNKYGTPADAVDAYAAYRKVRLDNKTTPAEATTALKTLIAQVGDSSNLILDPDLDSFYVMDIEVTKLEPSVEMAGRRHRDVSY